MASVLITDGEQRAALAAVRSLGRAGHDVFVCSAQRRSLAGASRHARAQVQVPDPHRGFDPFIAALRGLIGSWGIEVVLPIAEISALAVLKNRETLLPALVPFPSYDRFVRVCDKRIVLEKAASLGIRVPRQLTLMTPEDGAALDVRDLDFPLVIKPTRSIIENGGGRAKSSLMYAADASTLRAALARQSRHAYPLLLQHRVIGPGIGIFLLLRNGEPIALFSHRRIREKPPSGGVSVYRESIALDPSLASLSHQLLASFGWEGVAMVEYKLDRDTGVPYLMEINGRFWGSLQLAIDSGIDFPAMLVDVALGGHPEPVLTYRTGVRSRWWLGDADHLVARLRRSREDLALPPDAPGRARVVAEFLAACAPGTRNEVLRLNDPMPALREAVSWIRSPDAPR